MLFRSNVLLLGLGHFQSHTCLVSRADLGDEVFFPGLFNFLHSWSLYIFVDDLSWCVVFMFHFISFHRVIYPVGKPAFNRSDGVRSVRVWMYSLCSILTSDANAVYAFEQG
jgi:hypothetical protein